MNKIFKSMLLMLTMLPSVLMAREHQIIDVLGISPKGQFVAVEEYGYKAQSHTYYVTVKVMNVWTKEYVGQKIDVELPAHRPNFLDKARSRAKILAVEELKKFNISG